MEALVSEKINVQSAFDHADVAGQETARIGLKGALKLRCVIRVASVAQDLVLTLREHTAASGGTSQDLVRKLPAVIIADGSDAVVRSEDSTAVVTASELNGSAVYAIVEVQGSDLSEGFSHFSVQMASAALRNGNAHYEADTERKPAYEQKL